MMNDVFIFTEAYNCGLILKKCLESFFKHHDANIHVFGRRDDFEEMGHFDKVIYHDTSGDIELENSFLYGHLGTAHIFSRVIVDLCGDKKYIIHFDSDTIFRAESLSLILNKFKEGYDLVGPRRCYKNNLNGRNDLNNLPDVTQTYFYGFNKTKITNFDFNILKQMIVGSYNPSGHPILDYFDPVSFNIINNGGKVFYLDFNLVGAQDENGNRINKYGEISKDCDFGDNIIHFAGIGSGMKFYKLGKGHVPVFYYEWAIKRYATYMKLMYDEIIDDNLIDYSAYELIKREL